MLPVVTAFNLLQVFNERECRLMPQPHASHRLGPLDALFLYLEKKEMPLHIGSVFLFDGPIARDDLKSLIEAKLPLIPRYRQRLVFPPLNAGYPTWEDDPEFELERHIHQVELKFPTKAALQALAGRVFSELMDRNRPLWDLTVVHGCEGGCSALIARVHHCLVDGVAGVRLMGLILDSSSRRRWLPPKQPFHPRPLPSAATSLMDALISSYAHMADRLLSVQSAALNVAAATVGELLQRALAPTASIVPELLPPAQRFPFHASAHGPRAVSWAEFRMDHINAIGKTRGVTVNDVVLLILAGAVRRYARVHKQSLKRRFLRLMVPVNLRGDDHEQTLGNRISLMPVSIPLDVRDPVELLGTIHERTEGLKHAQAANLMALGGTLLSIMPIPAQAALVGSLANVVPVLPFDMVCTNVAGPQSPLFLLGRKMLTYYPYVPIGDFMGICCAAASYNGVLYFGLTGDCACAPDLDRLRDFLQAAFSEVLACSGATAPRPRRMSVQKSPKRREPAGSLTADLNGMRNKTRPNQTLGEPIPTRN